MQPVVRIEMEKVFLIPTCTLRVAEELNLCSVCSSVATTSKMKFCSFGFSKSSFCEKVRVRRRLALWHSTSLSPAIWGRELGNMLALASSPGNGGCLHVIQLCKTQYQSILVDVGGLVYIAPKYQGGRLVHPPNFHFRTAGDKN